MAPGDPIPPERTIYRAIRSKQLNPDKTINEIAFLLKPAHGDYEDETYLSFGISVEGAKAGLTNIRHVAEISVADILALGLRVIEDEDAQKVRVSGMPLEKTDPALARAFAKDLRNKAKLSDSN